jgi:hypothetical protein
MDAIAWLARRVHLLEPDRRPPAVRIEQVFVADLLIPKHGAQERPRLGSDERVDRRR